MARRRKASTHTFSPDAREAIVGALNHWANTIGDADGLTEAEVYALAKEIEARKSNRVVERIPHEVTEPRGLGSYAGRLSDLRERHESFGLVGISRIHGRTGNLFGSHLDYHTDTFRFTVKRAVREHSNLAYDRHHSDGQAARPDLIEFELSATQFVELMTSLNVGEGVPCTLRYVLGEKCEPVPDDHKTERELIYERFSGEMQDVAKSVQPIRDSIEKTLGKRSIGKADREQIRSDVHQIVQVFADHAPFVMKQFSESTDRLELAGKAEVEAYAESVIRSAGLHYLRSLATKDPEAARAALEAIEVEALPAGEDEA